MNQKAWLLLLWPGMAALWVRPTLTAWLGSAAMAVVFHLALATTILWPEWLSPGERAFLWIALGVAWLSGVAWSYQFIRRENARQHRPPAEDPFPAATAAYLRGDLAGAESLVREILRECPRDMEAALLLATIWRRRKQFDAAEKLLRNLARLELAAPWLWDIERELLRIQKCREESAAEALTGVGDGQTPAHEPLAAESPPSSQETVAFPQRGSADGSSPTVAKAA